MRDPTPRRALAGVRVLEMGSLIAGPFCSRLLAEFGAEVIKIEAPRGGDQLRRWGKQPPGRSADSLWWLLQGRNKRVITLDLHHKRAQDLARQIATKSDVIVENFRPGKVAEWGLDYETVATDNPGVVYVSISGFGQTGPYRNRPGFGSTGEAIGGLRYITGSPDCPPSRVGISLGDSLAGLYGAFGAVMALFYRQSNGGRGQLVDVALYEAVFSMLESTVPDFDLLGHVRSRIGTRLEGVAPTNTYPTRDGEWIVVGGNSDAIFKRLMTAIGQAELATSPTYATNADRVLRADELDEIIGAWTRTLNLGDALDTLYRADVPAAPIYSAREMVRDEHYWAREMLLRFVDPRVGSLLIPGIVPKLSDSPGEVQWLGRPLGSDTVRVLREILGLGDDAIAELQTAGLV